MGKVRPINLNRAACVGWLLAALLLAACGGGAPAAPPGPEQADVGAARAEATLRAALDEQAAASVTAAPVTDASAAVALPAAPPLDAPAGTPSPTPSPTIAPTEPPAPAPDATATARAVAGLVETSVAATLAAQATSTARAEQAAAGVGTAVAATLTAEAPTRTPVPTSTPRPAPTATRVAPPAASGSLRLVYSFGDVRDADVRVYDPATGADWEVAGRGCDETEPGWAADGRTVFFQSDCGDGYDLFAVDADAAARGAATPVTIYGGPCDEREPDASPDGRLLAFRLSCGDDTFNIDGALHLLDLATGAATDLGLVGRSPVWSPDGTRLAYMSERSGGWEIYVFDLARGGETRLTRCDDQCRFPAWSPGGAEILFVESSQGVVEEDRTAWIVPADGSGTPRRFFSAFNLGRPSWSADGRLVYSDDTGLILADAAARNPRVLFANEDHWGAAWSFPPTP